MQLIIVFVLAVVVLGIVGTGLLAQPTNITLFVSALGFGEANLVSPIDDASIELMLDTAPSSNPEEPLITIVTACGFRSQDIIPLGTGRAEGKIVCKLLNADGNAIAEGDIPLSSYDPADTLVIIPINQPAFLGATNFALVDDAMVIIQGPL
ncbi:MAG: hypothetical protein ACT4NJ_05530 [Nitrosopumilaceae archaeon]